MENAIIDISSLFIAILAGLFIWFLAASFPPTNKNNAPIVLGVLAGILAYFGAFYIQL